MIDWLLQSYGDHPDLARGLAPPGLLSAAEAARLDSFRVEKRRREWLLGRWTAKRLLQTYLEEHTGQRAALDALIVGRDPGGVPIVVADPQRAPPALLPAEQPVLVPLIAEAGLRPGEQAPVVLGVRLPFCLSISHSGDMAFCALHPLNSGAVESSSQDDAPGPGLAQLGADIEAVEARSALFLAQFFSAAEIKLVERAFPAQRNTLTTAIWSAKEAVLKALRLGLTVDTRRVTCLPSLPRYPGAQVSQGWLDMVVTCDPVLLRLYTERTGRKPETTFTLAGWWRMGNGYVLTLASLMG
jgi:4'-phosphopantetheinyl transferase